METVYVIKENFQGYDGDCAYHWVEDRHVAICATKGSALAHIEMLLMKDYEEELQDSITYPEVYPKPDKLEYRLNKTKLTTKFNGKGGKLYEKYFIEEEELIE